MDVAAERATAQEARIDHWKRAAVVLWVVWAIIVFAVALANPSRSVIPVYFITGKNWLDGATLHHDHGLGFLYLPPTAAFFAAFSSLPEPWGRVAWHAFAMGTFATGIWRATQRRVAAPYDQLLVALAATTVSFAAARNGQATLPMAGALLHACAELERKRWTRAGLLIVGAILVKPLAIVFALAAIPFYPRIVPAVLGGSAALLLAPFAEGFQDGWERWTCFAKMIVGAEQVARDSTEWAQPFVALRIWGVELPHFVETLLRMGGALCVPMALLVVRCLPSSRREFATSVYFVSMAWLMLANPRSENNSYALISVGLGWVATQALADRKRANTAFAYVLQTASLIAAVASIVGLTAAYEICRAIAPDRPRTWFAPLVWSCFVVFAGLRRLPDLQAYVTSNRAESAGAVAA